VDLNSANLRDAIFSNANITSAKLNRANLGGADLNHANMHEAEPTEANLNLATLSGADLTDADFSFASLIHADISGADLSGVCLDDANHSGWKIEGVKCTHIRQWGQRIDFAPGEFEKKYTWLESVAEVMLRLPLSDLTLYAGSLMAQAVNQAQGEGAVQFKGVEALADDTTLLKFILFTQDQNQQETRAKLSRIEQAINQQVPVLPAPAAEAAPDEPEEIIGWRKSWGIPFTPLEVRPQAMEQALNRRFAALPPDLQALWQLMQSALNP
jgi:uncharacterized protein YjbI with pentapeptide repeats